MEREVGGGGMGSIVDGVVLSIVYVYGPLSEEKNTKHSNGYHRLKTR